MSIENFGPIAIFESQEEAEDGVQGLEKIKNTDYDLVLCDIKMPKMDGEELLEAVKKINTSLRNEPFAAEVNYTTKEEAARMAQGAADDFKIGDVEFMLPVHKPILCIGVNYKSRPDEVPGGGL